MRTHVRLAFLICLAITTPAAAQVGFQRLSIPDPTGPSVEIGVWYPADAAPAPGAVDVAPQLVSDGAPAKGARLPLVVMSHGNGGSYASHADTAQALAKAGFVAAALTHTGDNWRDQSRALAMPDRPRQLKLLTDYMLTAWPEHGRIDPAQVGAFGFSSGGFTVLVAAGGVPNLGRIAAHCRAHPAFYDCQLTARHQMPADATTVWIHDTRIKAVVSAAPALGFTFGPEGLAGVRQPLQLWRATDDTVLPHPFYAEAVRLALPSPPDYQLAPGAGHFDFLSPCSPALRKAAPMICVSAPGFDRASFHADFNAKVVAFFAARLPAR